MRFIHVADVHASKERLGLTLKILGTLKERADKGDIDFIVFAGDFWDTTVTATKGSGFADLLKSVRELEKSAPLYFIYGTPTHEPSGSLDAFKSERTHVYDKMCLDSGEKSDFIFIPEPRRSDYITGSAKDTDALINRTVKEFVSKLSGDKNRKKPLIVVYHGEVGGAVYQNGTSASSPTAIPKDLLQSLGADYYALGHIHLPQEVFKNAWYSGSAAPKDFGETHTGSYHIVTVEDGKTDVEIIPFGLPTYRTLQVKMSGLGGIKADWQNTNVRLQFQCTKEERKLLDIRKLQKDIKEKTNAVSVKIEPTVIDGEAVSESKVSRQKSAVDKMGEYAKEKGLDVPAGADTLLKSIEENMLIKYAYPQHSFELVSVSLRGAIGIRDGQHKEEMDIDFGKFGSGVVCLVGANGHGKSTLIENCHPYPCMLTRGGALKDHFYLKDSHRILVYKDENNVFYRISMLIDGKTKTGKATYFAETSKDNETWSPVPETDGSLAAYSGWVERTFGSIDVYLRTAFFAKEQTKDASDITSATKGERMELLSKLAGTEYLKEISVEAREERKSAEEKSAFMEAELGSLSKFEDIIKSNEKNIRQWNIDLERIEKDVDAAVAEVKELREKDKKFQQAKSANETSMALRSQYVRQAEADMTTLAPIAEILKKENAKELFKDAEKHKKEKEELEKSVEQWTSAVTETRKEYDRVADDCFILSSDINDRKVSVARLDASIKSLETQRVDIGGSCPTCGAPLSEHKRAELMAHVNSADAQIKALEKQRNEQEKILRQKEKELHDKNLDGLKKELAAAEKKLDGEKGRKKACEEWLESADGVIVSYDYDGAVRMRNALTEEISSLEKKSAALPAAEDCEDVSAELAEAERRLQEKSDERSGIIASVKSAENENARYAAELMKADGKKKELKKLRENIAAYLFIENSFGNKGIPAVELRESAPEIAMTANKILGGSFGNKFEIRFGSTSELNAKRKADEDFNILVYDSENGDEKTIDLVSSGERIWIKQALFYAFSIVQMERTGFNFRTRFIDESDGSLDGAMRPKYLRMVEEAHKAADARITVLITHSQEIKDIAEQFIEM